MGRVKDLPGAAAMSTGFRWAPSAPEGSPTASGSQGSGDEVPATASLEMKHDPAAMFTFTDVLCELASSLAPLLCSQQNNSHNGCVHSGLSGQTHAVVTLTRWENCARLPVIATAVAAIDSEGAPHSMHSTVTGGWLSEGACKHRLYISAYIVQLLGRAPWKYCFLYL